MGSTRGLDIISINYNYVIIFISSSVFVGHHHKQTHILSVNKTRALLQTTGGKDVPNIDIKMCC
jgi:hypothetical protein